MLKRIGMGRVFASLTNEYNKSHQLPVDYHWILTGIIYFFIFITSPEFTVAQSPTRMRGLMVGLWYAALGFGSLIGTNIYRVFLCIESVTFGCGFNYFCTCAKSGCILLLFIVYLFLSKHYKLRVRENIVSIHRIAEEHIQRDIDQREEDYWSSDSTSS